MALSKKLVLTGCWVVVSLACASAGGCTSNDMSSGQDSGADGTSASGSSSSSGGGNEGGGSSDVAPHDGAATDVVEGGGLGLLVDNMTALTGTRISLTVPPSETPGSYYTYPDMAFNYVGIPTKVLPTGSLADTSVSPAILNADGSQIVGKICFNGSVVNFAGLGMSLAYGNAPDAALDAASAPVPFDASHYSGVSFYVLGNSADASISKIHFGVPDSQTADPSALPTSDCAVLDGGKCDDDFGADVPYTPGQWTKVAFKWDELLQQGFGNPGPTTGNPISSIKTTQLIGMKWQANGSGVDAAVDSFNFCISDIYFTP